MWRGVPVLLKGADNQEAARLLALFDRFRSRLIDFIACFMTSLWVIRDAADPPSRSGGRGLRPGRRETGSRLRSGRSG
jgi:hypothetical protein